MVKELCLACGLCCNGVIFADVRLQAGDDAARQQFAELPLGGLAEPRGAKAAGVVTAAFRASRLPQPCAAFDGCRCRIYDDRPRYCREFECALLKQAKAGQVSLASALRMVRQARQRADHVLAMLRDLGDTDEGKPLSLRFRRTGRRLEAVGSDGAIADVYGQLTLAMHDLNCLLSESFYPGA